MAAADERSGVWARSRAGAGTCCSTAHAWRVAVWTVARLVLGPLGFSLALVAVLDPDLGGRRDRQAACTSRSVGGLVLRWPSDHVSAIVAFWTLVGSPVAVLAPAFAWSVRGVAALHVLLAAGPGREREEEVRAATERAELAEEQVRIDQELHDSIGHMITMNIIQAGAGAHVFDSDPEFARQALQEHRGAGAGGDGRTGPHHRDDQGRPPGDEGPARAAWTTSRGLSTSRGAAGMTIEAHIDAPPVPAAVGRAAFVIVREALTNAARHAPGAP